MALRVLMLSGGFDSVATLYHMCQTYVPGDTLHVHHICYETSQGRSRAEGIAVKNILEYCRDNFSHEIHFSSSGLDWGGMEYATPDIVPVMFTAALVIRSLHKKDNGRVPKTYISTGATNDDNKITWPEGFMESPRMKNGRQIFANCFFDYRPQDIPEFIYPLLNRELEDCYRDLPEELRRHALSCRTPHYASGEAVPCGHCMACKKITRCRRLLNEI